MCLLAFAWRYHPEYPLILIANRDEFYQRPTAAADWWHKDGDTDSKLLSSNDIDSNGMDSGDIGNCHIVGGRDLQAGGSWLALNTQGAFAAVTNYRDGQRPSATYRSRGQLISDFLLKPQSPQHYIQQLADGSANRAHPQHRHHLDSNMHSYGGFNLLVGDQHQLCYLSNRGGGHRVLSPGLYGLSNAWLDTDWPKTTALKQRLQHYLMTVDTPEPQALLQLLSDRQQAADHQLPNTGISTTWEKKLSACFIQDEAQQYGTLASSVLLLKRTGERLFVEQSFTAAGTPATQAYFALPAPIAT